MSCECFQLNEVDGRVCSRYILSVFSTRRAWLSFANIYAQHQHQHYHYHHSHQCCCRHPFSYYTQWSRGTTHRKEGQVPNLQKHIIFCMIPPQFRRRGISESRLFGTWITHVIKVISNTSTISIPFSPPCGTWQR